MLTKREFRLRAAAERDALTPEESATRSLAIQERLSAFGPFAASRAPLLFVSFRSEPHTHGIIRRALAEGKRVLVPKVDRKAHEMILSELRDFDSDLAESAYGILEPRPEALRPAAPEEIDFVLAPGLAFDRRGFRLGYGGGYYDRLLSRMRPGAVTAAIAFSFQIHDEIPADATDRKVGAIITDKETIVIG
jgi:5-formyltetrahydrofolate cyclo-ligase